LTQLKPLSVALGAELAFAGAVTAVEVVDVTPEQRVPGAAPLGVTPALVNGLVRLTISGGSDGERYHISVRATLADGATATRDLDVAVIDPDWSMPGGGPSYLSLFEFVSRFGLDETVNATQSSADGLIDRSFLIGALSDAQAEVEANLAGRYALPLSVVPALVKTAIADLAAVRMYRRGAPDFVVDQAKVQRRLLERIASGALPLGIPAGVALDPAPSEAPIIGWTGRQTYSDGLKDF
jgi:phage gp36-like protein